MPFAMKLIRQTKLHFRSEKSDKVYEVDLCEAGEGEFIVNFRYGRRGTTLREGTKTPFPESRSKAEDIFDKLVKSKTDKGYQYTEETVGMPVASETPAIPSPTPSNASDPRIEAMMRILRAAAAGQPTGSSWSVSRAIWTAGAWMVEEAAPLIAQISTSSTDPFVRWSAAWALGRCGGPEHILVLDNLAAKGGEDSSLRRMAFLAKLALVDDAQRTHLTDNEIAKLPPSVRAAIENEDVAALAAAIRDHLTGDAGRWIGASLYGIAMSRPWIREAIHEVVVQVAPDENTMRFLRQTFKAVEMTMDAELFGAIVRKFETSPGRGRPRWVYKNGRWEMGRAPAFSAGTKAYFQRRFVRHLHRAGESGRPELFIPLATGVLLANDDEQQRPEEELEINWHYSWSDRRYLERRRYGPRYARQHCFLWVLRSGGNTIYTPLKSLRWWYRSSDSRGFATTREEPFPHLWDQAPDAVAHLLRHARSEEVQRFALRVWRANPSFANEVDEAFIGDLLGSWFQGTIELGLDLARTLWDPNNPNISLLLAVMDADLDAARELGRQWLDAVQSRVRNDQTLLRGLAFLRHADAQERARALAKTATLSSADQQTLVGLIVSSLVSMTSEEDEALCAHASDFVLLIAAQAVGQLNLDHVGALLTHPLEAGQQLGAHALLRRADIGSVPDAMLLGPLSSDFASVRRLGMQVMGRLDDYQLGQRAELVAGFGTSQHAEIRQEGRTLIERLVRTNMALGRELVEQWYPLVLREERYDGLHADIYALLTGPLKSCLDTIPEGAFRRMLGLKYGYAHLLGFALLQRETRFDDEPVEAVVNWGCHDLLVLREAVREHFDLSSHRLAEQPGAMTPMLESSWDDARDWAFEFCRNKIPEDAWDAEGLITVCDSVKPMVRAFGREMVTRRFRNEDGPLYLRRLSEHPTSDLQVFATNYLARFAADDLQALKGLDLYFRVVLSRIGAGRVAKDRVLTFLRDEALKSEDAARYVEPLLRRQVATVAIGDKATCIRVLADIRRRWPTLPTGLRPKSPAVYKPEAR